MNIIIKHAWLYSDLIQYLKGKTFVTKTTTTTTTTTTAITTIIKHALLYSDLIQYLKAKTLVSFGFSKGNWCGGGGGREGTLISASAVPQNKYQRFRSQNNRFTVTLAVRATTRLMLVFCPSVLPWGLGDNFTLGVEGTAAQNDGILWCL